MFSHAGRHGVSGVSCYDKTKCHPFPEQLVVLWLVSQTNDRHSDYETLSRTFAIGAACSYFCPVPGRRHSALSYSGARKSCHYRVGGHRARSRDRFTLKAIAKEGTFIRREKKRSIKGKHSFKFRNSKSIFSHNYLLSVSGEIIKELAKQFLQT